MKAFARSSRKGFIGFSISNVIRHTHGSLSWR